LTADLKVAVKALRQIGPTAVGLNALYRLGLKTGWFKKPVTGGPPANLRSLFLLPSRQRVTESIGAEGLGAALAEADEVVAGRIRLFGAEPVHLDFSGPGGLRHWTAYETDPAHLPTLQLPNNDIKFLWEPARFGFAFTLGRAYHFAEDEKYPAAFWHHFETFSAANPAPLGPNWMSGQEVALRLMAFAWAGQVFSAAEQSTPRRLRALGSSIAAHAERIPPTLIYARSQNNNHLLSEAAGLYTAACALPEHPHARRWRSQGETWLRWCFEHQVDETGEYVQHSTNYQRLMLQIALWVCAIAERPQAEDASSGEQGIPLRSATGSRASLPSVARSDAGGGFLSERARENLARATSWLLTLADPESGRAPNLGANDGAYIFPLSSLPFEDYRPTLQAASIAFCGEPAFDPGPWDETAAWLANRQSEGAKRPSENRIPSSTLQSRDSSAHLRAVRFTSRPSHADQLHLDLWWRGQNLALDPGTYLYNAAPPWENALTTALVHNTVTVDDLDQMIHAGKFLYLDWAQAKVVEQGGARLAAEHDGYRRLGVIHRRTLTAIENGWLIEDELRASHGRSVAYRLHWLLPDWEYELQESSSLIRLRSPFGRITLQIRAQETTGDSSAGDQQLSLIRGGHLISGAGPAIPICGWVSPTYGVKLPALSLVLEVESRTGVRFLSEFSFPAGS
jgi:hypothetical protein